MEANHALHDWRGQGNLVPGNRAICGCHEGLERFLHGVRFVYSARGTRGRNRAKGFAGAVLLKQKLGCLCNPMVVGHPRFS
jgi:hypothetical protein